MRQRHDGSGLYVLAAAMCDEADTESLRTMVGKLTDGQHHFHWRDEKPAGRHRAAALVGSLEALHLVVIGTGLDNPRQERGRRQCMRRLLWELDQAGITHVWLDARRPAQNRRDIQLVDVLRLQGALSEGFRVDFVHRADDPLAWLPDIVAGATSAAYGDGDNQHLATLTGVLNPPITIMLT